MKLRWIKTTYNKDFFSSIEMKDEFGYKYYLTLQVSKIPEPDFWNMDHWEDVRIQNG